MNYPRCEWLPLSRDRELARMYRIAQRLGATAMGDYSGGSGGTTFALSTAVGQGRVNTTETTSSVAYVDLATVGPSTTLTIGPSGSAFVLLGCGSSNTIAANNTFMTVALSGGNTVAAADANALIGQGSPALEFDYVPIFTGLAVASTTFTAKYRVIGGTGTFNFRTLVVVTF